MRCHNGWRSDTAGGLLEHVPEICLFYRYSFFFLVKSKTSGLGTTQVQNCQDFQIIRCWISRILLYIIKFVNDSCALWLQRQQFNAFCGNNMDTSLWYVGCAKNVVDDPCCLSQISSIFFFSFSMWLLHVLILSEMEPPVHKHFTYL